MDATESVRRQANLQAILKWSLKQTDTGLANVTPMDEEKRKWLEEALSSLSSQPSETDLLKAAIAVLKAHAKAARELSAEESDSLQQAFEQMQYFIEDLDHAKDLIPLDAVGTIISYVDHDNSDLSGAACESVATATQSLPVCQQAFAPVLPRLLKLVTDPALPNTVRTKGLYALSCLLRENPSGVKDLLSHGGLILLLTNLDSGVRKLIIKTLFLISCLFTSEDTKVVVKAVATETAQRLVAYFFSLGDDEELLALTVSGLNSVIECDRHGVLLELSSSRTRLTEEAQQRLGNVVDEETRLLLQTLVQLLLQ